MGFVFGSDSIRGWVGICTLVMGLSGALGIEWPVFFEHMGYVHSAYNKWDLGISVGVQVPLLEKRILKVNRRLKYLYEGFSRRETGPSKLEDSWKYQNAYLRRKANNLIRRTIAIKDFGSPSLSPSEGYPKRMKRSENEEDWDFEGRGTSGVLQSLFGVAYTNDVNVIETRIDGLQEKLENDLDAVQTKQNSLKKDTSFRILLHDGELKRVENKTEMLEKKIVDMELNPSLRSTVRDSIRQKRDLAYEEVERRLSIYNDRLTEIETLISVLSSGKLSIHAISPPKLRKALAKIRDELPHNYTLLFDHNRNLWPYYNLLSIEAHFSKGLEEILIKLKIPLIDLGNPRELNKVHNLPLKVRDGYTVTADINTEYLVTDVPRKYFLELQKKDLQDCSAFNHNEIRHYYCNLGPMLKEDISHSCVTSLFKGNTGTALCQSKLKHGLVTPFTRLHNGSWIFSALNEQIPVLLKCPDGDTPTGLLGFGVIHLAEGCSISSYDYFYPKTFSGTMKVGVGFGDPSWSNQDRREGINILEPDNQKFTNEEPKFPPFKESDDLFDPEIIEAVVAENEDYDDASGEEENELTFEEFLSAVATNTTTKHSQPLNSNSSFSTSRSSKTRIFKFF